MTVYCQLMNLKEILASGYNVIKILIKDEEFQTKLASTGEIGSIIDLGITIWKKTKNNELTKQELAFGSLFKIILESAKESLNSISQNRTNIEDVIDRKEFFEIFQKESNQNGNYVPQQQTVKNFCDKISRHIKFEVDSETLTKFVIKFNLLLDEKSRSDDDFLKYYEPIQNIEDKSKKLIEYLEYVKTSNRYRYGLDKKFLNTYYIKTEIKKLPITKWSVSDIETKTYPSFDWPEFLESKNWYVVLGSNFGMGKTSMMRELTAKFAEQFLNDPFNSQSYIPIPVFLNKKLNNVYHQRNLDEFFEFLKDDIHVDVGKKILLIIDGLDEYGENIEELLKKIKSYKKKYVNLKLIITTRLESKFPKILEVDDYVRLLPFTNEQVDQFFKKYNVNYSYDKMKNLELHQQEITKPLFCWMLANTNLDPYFKLELKPDWNQKLKRTILYLEFIHSIIRGKHKDEVSKNQNLYFFVQEKQVLRKIAALYWKHKQTLRESELKQELNIEDFTSNQNMLKIFLGTLLTSYFYQKESEDYDKRIEFIHKTFSEYLLAEFFIESIILKHESNLINIESVSSETIDFITGLNEILTKDDLGAYKEKLLQTFPESTSNLSEVIDENKRKIEQFIKNYAEKNMKLD